MRDYVYSSDFNLSWSIKSVIPAIFGDNASYANMNVKNGLEAQETYLKAIAEGTFGKVKNDLIDYCNKDVMEMVNLYLYLEKKILDSQKGTVPLISN